MKNSKKHISFLTLLMLMISFTSCGEDDNNQEEEDMFAGCCSDDPVFGPNVNNLDQPEGGEILVSDIVTPNGDATNDYFGITNIGSYLNHMVTIYNSNDEVIFENNDYVGSVGNTENLFPNQQATDYFEALESFPDGTYKYKIVIENEQTFLKSGTFCLFTGDPSIPVEEQNFSECIDPGEFDPVVVG